MSYVKEKLKEFFENTVDSGVMYDGKITNLEYYSLYLKAGENDQIFKLLGCDICMFNCSYKGEDSVMMIFCISISDEESGAKNIAERVMEIITNLENAFVTLDFVMSEEVKEDKFVYVTTIKKIK